MSTSLTAAQVLAGANTAFYRDHGFVLPTHTIALIETGSSAYGTSTPESDHDYTAIVIPPVEYLLGLHKFQHFEPGVDNNMDVKGMSLTKFVTLALDGNPNVVEMLFFEPEQFLYLHPDFTSFLAHKNAFLSRRVFEKFAGYARGQFKKMEAGKVGGYAGHKRKVLVEQIGYDPKDASHLLRLLYKGIELARWGTLTPRLYDAQRLMVMQIKRGEWTLERIKDFAEHLSEVADHLFQRPACPLPEEPDRELIEQILISTHRRAAR